jgi:hypothetical protein
MQLFEIICNIIPFKQYIFYMKKIIFILFLCLGFCVVFSSCTKKVDYYSYISELRKEIYLYEEDDFTCKIYVSDRETPYLSDGIKGQINSIVEVFVYMNDTPKEVEIAFGNLQGEMNYLSVSKSFYLSFTSDEINADKVQINLNIDGKQKQIEALNVMYDGVIDAESALKCVCEYDAGLFEKLTVNNVFNGEIYLRLLYDDGCFYYVGVIDKSGTTNAYLVDGETGRILAQRSSNG